jgi:tRNA A-37 threonylcarbamoyl transferase component Bud32
VDRLLHIMNEMIAAQQGKRWHLTQSTDPAKLWIHFICENISLPQQGWKLHISAGVSSAEVVLSCVLPLLLEASSPFKVIASSPELANLNQGLYGFSQVGKFITIYPQNDQEAILLAVKLDEATRDLIALTIPSDCALRPGSLVHYRYGSFGRGLYVQDASGSIETAVRTPENELLPDRRTTRYNPPAWAVNPFIASGTAVESTVQVSRLINKRYLIARTIALSPRHAVYLALDLDVGRPCVIKGPGFAYPNGTVDTALRTLLRHEASILALLAPDPHIPTLYALIEQEDAVFLIIEDIPGELLATRVTKAAEMGEYVPLWEVIHWAKELAGILERIHTKGLVYADLKPSNIIIGVDGKVCLIDFELTCAQGGQGEYGTWGYRAPQRSQGGVTIADDIYSLGALLYFMLTGVEPSNMPRNRPLMERPLEWFRAEGSVLKEIVARCLHKQPEERYASMVDIRMALEAAENAPLSPGELQGVLQTDNGYSEVKRHAHELSKKLLDTICTVAQCAEDQEELFWTSTHPLTYGLAARDLNSGNAGTILALAELVAEHPSAQKQAVLARGARWLSKATPIGGRPLPGLYIGEAGVGAALLRSGQVLHDNTLITAAIERGRLVASLQRSSPDVFVGVAGCLRFHLMLWDETGEREHLCAALACGEHLLATSEGRSNQEVCWIIPAGYRSMSGEVFLGYAHGAAGIADALLDLFEASSDERYLSIACAAARWLKRQALPLSHCEDALNWPRYEGGPPVAAFWCHGSAGIGRFFLHAARYDVLPEAKELAAGAARAVACGTRWAGPTQCHGLSGNIEFLLDMYQATKEHIYLDNAFLLASCLLAFATEQNGLFVFSSEQPTTFTPDYMIGYAGVAVCFLRLSETEHRPHQLSRSGFRYTSSQAQICCLP